MNAAAGGPRKSIRTWRQGAWGGVWAVAAGLALWFSPVLGDGLAFLSYDVPTLLRPPQPSKTESLTIVYLDFRTLNRPGENADTIDRTHHARLLDRLTRDGARLVVFDIVFTGSQSESGDQALARAIQENGRVVLAAIDEKPAGPGAGGYRLTRPLSLFEQSAAGIGLAGLDNASGIVRAYGEWGGALPSLPLAAARAAGMDAPDSPEIEPALRWIHYYGPPGPRTISRVPFEDWEEQSAGFFSNKFVFVGTHPHVPDPSKPVDVFPVPHSRIGGGLSPGVEIWAHAFLNLVQHDGLRRWSALSEILLMILMGGLMGFGLVWVPMRWGFVLGLLAGLVLAGLGTYSLWHLHQWFCWTLVAGGQVPVALGWAFWVQLKTVSREKEILEERLATTMGSAVLAGQQTFAAAATSGHLNIPRITDYTLIRRIGRGAYGEVWLARNVVGIYNAVKVVYRGSFDKAGPFEREFAGIETFMPISRSHPGFVNILHAGRDERDGFFFYVMEAADDVHTGQQFDPKDYVPRTLAWELNRRGRLSPAEGLDLMLHLSAALQCLHEHRLIHRDIKPANIIYVRGQPKLADIGLVTHMAATGREVTAVGTVGYAAPEGPGTPAADVFSLGKVLYETILGQDPELFPEWPTAMAAEEPSPLLDALNRVLGKACDQEAGQRYASAGLMHAELMRIKLEMKPGATPP